MEEPQAHVGVFGHIFQGDDWNTGKCVCGLTTPDAIKNERPWWRRLSIGRWRL